MSDEEKIVKPAEVVVKKDHNKYRKEKPWDNDPNLDKFKEQEFKPEDNPHGGVVEESSLAVLFPAYRERYIKEVFPLVKQALKPYKINAELDLL